MVRRAGGRDFVEALARGIDVLTASWGGAIHLWDGRTGELRNVLMAHDGSIPFVAFLEDGHLVSAGYDLRIAWWDESARSAIRIAEPPDREKEAKTRWPTPCGPRGGRGGSWRPTIRP